MAWSAPSAIGTVATNTGNGSLTPGLPTHSAGDALFLVAGCRYNTTLGTLATPAGYTIIKRQTGAALSEICLWMKKSTGGGESAPTVTITGATNGASIAYMFKATGGDVDALASIADVIQVATDATADTALDVAAISPSVDNCLVLTLGFHNDNATVSSGPVGYTNHASGVNASGGGARMATAYVIQTTKAAISAGSFTMSTSANQNSLVVSLKVVGGSPAIPTGWGSPSVGAVATGNGTSQNTLTPSLPSYSVGDHLIALLCSRGAADTWTAPAGWTIPTGGQYSGMAIAVRVAQAGDTNPTFTRSVTSTNAMDAYILAANGGDTTLSTLIDTQVTSGTGASTTTIALGALSAPANDGSLILALGRFSDNTAGTSFSKPTWADGKIAEGAQGSGGGLTLVSAYKLQGVKASLSSDQFGTASISAATYGWVIALKSLATTATTLGITSTTTVTVGSTFTATVTNASSSGNSAYLDGEALTISSESSTSITFSAVSLGNKRYGDVELVITRVDGQSVNATVTINPEANVKYATLTTPYGSSNRPTTTATDLDTLDQLRVYTPTNTTMANVSVDSGGGLVVNPTNPDLDCSVMVQAHDGVSWGTGGLQTFKAQVVTSPTESKQGRRNMQRRKRQSGII